MRARIAAVALAALAALAALPAFPAARLTYDVRGVSTPVAWPRASFPIRYGIDRPLSDALKGTSTIDSAFNAWTVIPDADVSFQRAGIVDLDPVLKKTQGGKDGINSVSLTSGLFADQKFIALTTNWYHDDGSLYEADIQLDPSALASNYNVQQIVEHEVGHLLGLDHSAVLTSVMYPYVGQGGSTALDSDDRIAIAQIYPRNTVDSVGSTLEGRVMGDRGGVFAAQVVALNDQGEPVATGLTDPYGQFVLKGVPEGTYRIYAEPLDGPVDTQNLQGVYRSASVKSFPTRFTDSGTIRVDGAKVYGNLTINGSGATQLNPKWIGAFPPQSSSISLSSMPVTVKPGTTTAIAIGGDGFVSGMTTFDIPNSGFRRVSDFSYAGNYAYATFTIAPDAAGGSVAVLVKSGNESAALTGALRVDAKPRARAVRH
jgi:hypothetical protein